MKNIYLGVIFLLSACSSRQITEVKKEDRSLRPIAQAPTVISKASESVFLMFLADRPQNFDLSTSKKLDDFFSKQSPPFVSLEKKL